MPAKILDEKNSPTAGKFSEEQVLAMLNLERWILVELHGRGCLLPDPQTGLYSEFSIARFRSSQDAISFVSKMRRSKDEILALRQQTSSRTYAAKKAAHLQEKTRPDREQALERRVQELTEQVAKLTQLELDRAERWKKD